MQALDDLPHNLPRADPASLDHSAQVAGHIRQIIRESGGSIGFAEFMHHALYAPGLGYYTAGSGKFGDAGDFVTAPEISPVFSRVLARQVAAVLDQLAEPADKNILEFGAGSGVLAVELLRKLETLGNLPTRYYILDVSADLTDRQASAIKSAMPEFFDRVKWLKDIPDGFSGVVLANEVLDAFPVERFARDGGVYRQSVACRGDGFVWRLEPAPKPLRQAVAKIEENLGHTLPRGYVSEVSLAADHWIADIANCLRQGAVFLFDYGVSHREYYAPDRSDGWLRCHFRHHAHGNPLLYPGIQDLTAWVNFSQIVKAAHDNGLAVAGYTTQAQFLLNGGLQDELADFAGLPTTAQFELSRQVKVLTMPGEMGENIKCLALVKGPLAPPGAVAAADRSHTL